MGGRLLREGYEATEQGKEGKITFATAELGPAVDQGVMVTESGRL